MTTLHTASRQWATRPADERFNSLTEMLTALHTQRTQSREVFTAQRKISIIPTADNKDILLRTPKGAEYSPTHWSFGQLTALSEAPAGYLRTLPAPIVADCINYGLQFKRGVEDIGMLLHKDDTGDLTLRAATGPRYGRVWNDEVVSALVERFGDGTGGDWRVPGVFGQELERTTSRSLADERRSENDDSIRELGVRLWTDADIASVEGQFVTEAGIDTGNTTLFAGDRDMFVFLTDESNKIEIPNRRDGQPGLLSRGFFIWNSEVGSSTLGISTFLFDYVCCNRIVWGATDYKEVRVRHTSGAPQRWIEELLPALKTYSTSSTHSITTAIEAARADRLGDKLDDFLSKRFGKRTVQDLKDTHLFEEGRPIETRWDVVTAVTARARAISHQDARVEMEKAAGDLLTA